MESNQNWLEGLISSLTIVASFKVDNHVIKFTEMMKLLKLPSITFDLSKLTLKRTLSSIESEKQPELGNCYVEIHTT